MREPKPRKPGKTGRGPLAPFFQACCARFARTGPSPIACLDNSVLLHIFEDSDTQSSQNEDLKTDIIKSRDETIAARDAQIARLQSELDDLANAVVQARRGVQFPDGRGLMDKLNGLNAWCKVTVLRLESCSLGEGGGQRHCA